MEYLNDDNYMTKPQIGKTILVLYQDNCTICPDLLTWFDKFSKKPKLEVNIYALNIQHKPDMINHYKVKGVPTVIAFVNGDIITSFVGRRDLPTYENLVNNINNY